MEFIKINRQYEQYRKVRVQVEEEKVVLERKMIAQIELVPGDEQKAVEDKRRQIAELYMELEHEKQRQHDLALQANAFQKVRQEFDKQASQQQSKEAQRNELLNMLRQ